jgi:hypothetical protein
MNKRRLDRMRSKLSVFLLVSFVVGLCAFAAAVRAEEQKPQFFFVVEEVVKPSMVAEFEEATKKEFALIAEQNFPYACYTFNSDDYTYYYVWPLKDYADIGNLMKDWGEMVQKIGFKEWLALGERKGETFEHYKFWVMRHRPDLSYVQENPRFKPEEANFIYWSFCHVLPGKELEFENICKEWIEFDKKVNRMDSYDLYVGDIGTEMPFYFWTVRGKSAADFFNQQEIYGGKMGEEGMKLWGRTMALLRKFEDKTGYFRPGLSYIPK